MNHRYAPPTHEAVVKFSEVRTIPEIRDFHDKLRRQAGYFAKTRAVVLAVYFVREIERKNLIRLHLPGRDGQPRHARHRQLNRSHDLASPVLSRVL